MKRPEALAALDRLHDTGLNYDPEAVSGTLPAGWKVDELRCRLPGEPPGDPLPGGPWKTARRLMRDYEFADPGIVEAVFHPDQPLERRDMLLVAKFYGLRFLMGVRVGGVTDGTVESAGRRARVWGWNYRTLQGHLERGQMDFEVWKWLDDGTVEFRVHSVSQRARPGNPLVRLGLALFGRPMQRRFARRACERMQALVVAELSGRRDPRRRVLEVRAAREPLRRRLPDEPPG